MCVTSADTVYILRIARLTKSTPPDVDVDWARVCPEFLVQDFGVLGWEACLRDFYAGGIKIVSSGPSHKSQTKISRQHVSPEHFFDTFLAIQESRTLLLWSQRRNALLRKKYKSA
jgi:hypothetical protein